MAYVNKAVDAQPVTLPPEEYHADTPLEQYDLNYCFPVQALETDAVQLVPFIPSVHGKEAWSFFESKAGDDVYTYIPFPKPQTWLGFLTAQEGHRRNAGWLEFAIIDKSRRSGPRLAGMISLINSSAENLCAEVGAVFIFPEFQRTHVNTHATSLLLRYAFEKLKLRRVQWRANDLNAASISAARRLGFEYECTMKWDRVLPVGKFGRSVNSSSGYGTPTAGPGRHSAQLVITWEQWEDSVAQHIAKLLSREVIMKD